MKSSHTDEEIKRMFDQTRLPQIDVKSAVFHHDQPSVRSQTSETSGRFGMRRGWIVAVATVVLIVMAANMVNSSVVADIVRKIPVLGKMFTGDVFEYVGDRGSIEGKKKGLSSTVNYEASDQGVTIAIQEVLYDGIRLLVGYQMTAPNEDFLFLGDIEMKINGEQIPARYSSSPSKINDHDSAGVMNFEYEHPSSDPFILELDIHEISGLPNGQHASVEGDWSFKFSVAGVSEQNMVSKQFPAGISTQADGIEFTVLGIQITPVTTQVTYQVKGQPKGFGFQLLDDKGMLVNWLNSSQFTAGITEGTSYFDPVPMDAKYLYAVPFYRDTTKQPDLIIAKAPLTGQFPITLSQGSVGEVTVNNIEFLPDKTLIHYEAKGKDPLIQHTSLWLETVRGDQIINDNGIRTRVSDTSYSYILEYPALDPAEAYVIGTVELPDLTYLDDLRIKIPLEM